MAHREVPRRGIRFLSKISPQWIAHPHKYRAVVLHLIFQHDPVLIQHPVTRAVRRVPLKTDRHFRERVLPVKIHIRELSRHRVHNMRVGAKHRPVALHDRKNDPVLEKGCDAFLTCHRSHKMTAWGLDLKPRLQVDRGNELLIFIPDPLDPVTLLLGQARERKIPGMVVIELVDLFEIIAARLDRHRLRGIVIRVPKLIPGIRVLIDEDPSLSIVRLLVMHLVRRVIP